MITAIVRLKSLSRMPSLLSRISSNGSLKLRKIASCSGKVS
jgi:hypothetical protein